MPREANRRAFSTIIRTRATTSTFQKKFSVFYSLEPIKITVQYCAFHFLIVQKKKWYEKMSDLLWFARQLVACRSLFQPSRKTCVPLIKL